MKAIAKPLLFLVVTVLAGCNSYKPLTPAGTVPQHAAKLERPVPTNEPYQGNLIPYLGVKRDIPVGSIIRESDIEPVDTTVYGPGIPEAYRDCTTNNFKLVGHRVLHRLQKHHVVHLSDVSS